MSLRRLLVADATVAASALSVGLAAAPANAGICTQPSPECQAYDTAKSQTAAAINEAVFVCTATTDVPCGTVAQVGDTFYNAAFFPYEVCYGVEGVQGCIGPVQ